MSTSRILSFNFSVLLQLISMRYELDFDYEGLMDAVEQRYNQNSRVDERDEIEDDVLEALSEFSGESVYRLEERMESTKKLRE